MSDQWDKAVEKLIDLTQRGDIAWELSHDLCRRRKINGNFVGPAYLATVDEKRIAIYEHQYQRFVDGDDWHWDTTVAIEFIDANFEPEWVWPSPKGRFQLLEAVRYHTSQAEGFLERFLADTVT